MEPHHHENGSLISFERATLPFKPVRTFVVTAAKGSNRGQHAHLSCSQFLVALSGKVSVSVDDGHSKTVFELLPEGQGILIPPLLWSQQTYLEVENILLVACDQEFDERDYIREYLKFRKLVRGE